MSDHSELMSDLLLPHEHKAAAVIENLLSDREKQRRLLDSLRHEVSVLRDGREIQRKIIAGLTTMAEKAEAERDAARQVAEDTTQAALDAVSAHGQAIRQRDAAVKALKAITRRVPIMGSTGDYRDGQLHALEACSEVAKSAIDAARGEA